MANKKFNPFDAYAPTEEKVFIEALDYEVTLRTLTMSESDGFNKRLIGNYSGKGDPEINMEEATKINYEKVALTLIDPAMSVEQLQALGNKAQKAIGEIIKHIDGREEDDEEAVGNED